MAYQHVELFPLGEDATIVADQHALLSQCGAARVLMQCTDERGQQAVQLVEPGAGIGRRKVDVLEDPVTHRGEQLVLVLHVPVQRHRCDAEILRDAADRHRSRPVDIGQCERVIDDGIAGQRGGVGSGLGTGRRSRRRFHVDNCTP